MGNDANSFGNVGERSGARPGASSASMPLRKAARRSILETRERREAVRALRGTLRASARLTGEEKRPKNLFKRLNSPLNQQPPCLTI